MARRTRAASPALVIAMIALFVSIGGVGYAASTVGTRDIRNGAVTAKKLHRGAVTASKIAERGVRAGRIARGAVRSFQVKDGSLLARDFKSGQLPAGPRGARGPTGQQGPQGPQGSPGPTGPSNVLEDNRQELLALTTSFVVVAIVDLDPGSYWVQGTAQALQIPTEDPAGEVECRLLVPGAPTVSEFAQLATGTFIAAGTDERANFALQRTTSISAPGTAVLESKAETDLKGAAGGGSVVALKVGNRTFTQEQ